MDPKDFDYSEINKTLYKTPHLAIALTSVAFGIVFFAVFASAFAGIIAFVFTLGTLYNLFN